MKIPTISLAWRQWSWVIGCLLLPVFGSAQNSNSPIRLLDQASKAPIAGATYEYQSQTGISDDQGIIRIQYKENTPLQLSHISYGHWQLSDEEVKMAIKNGVHYRMEIFKNMQPVTIIALRPKMDETEILTLESQDRLAHDGGSVLNRTPAINSIRKSGSYGFDPVLRGFKYDQLNVVINGAQGATAACPNRMDPPTSQVAPNMMEKIEIMKGPHSLRYGSSFGGTINFVSSSPRFSMEKDIYGRLSGNYESNGGILRSEGLIGLSGKRYDIGLFGSWSQGNDYTDGDGNTVPSEFLRNSFGANLGLQIGTKQELLISGSRNHAKDVNFPALPMDLREDDTWMFNARHNIELKRGNLESWNTTAYLTLVDHLMDNLLKNLDPRMMNASTDAITRTYGGRTEGIWRFGQKQLFAGADLRIEEAEGIRAREFLLGPNAGKTIEDNAWQHGQISHSGVFAEYHFGLTGLNMILSGRLEYNQAKINDASDEYVAVYGDTESKQFNPSFSIGGLKHFESGFSIGLWLGRAQRSGSLTERYINYFPVGLDPYEMLGNPDLDAEVNNQADLSFGFKSKSTILDISLFAAFLQDYISSEIDEDLKPRLPNSPGVRQFINLEKAMMTGFEITWNQQLIKGLQHQLSVAYTYGKNIDLDEPLPEIAPLDFRYSLSGSYFKNKLSPMVSYRYVMEQDRFSSSFGENNTPSFSLIDVSLGSQITKTLSARAGVQNILDEAYFEHLNRSVRGTSNAIQAPGRNVFLSITLDLM